MVVNRKVYFFSYLSESGRSFIGLAIMAAILFAIALTVKNIIGMVITSIVFVLFLATFFKSVPNIEVDDLGLKVGSYQVLWKSVQSIKFTIGLGNDFGNTRIIISAPVGELIIIPRQYKEPKVLRKDFEQYCKTFNIKCVIEDKGV